MQIVHHSLTSIAITLPNPLSEVSTAIVTIPHLVSGGGPLIIGESVPTSTTSTIRSRESNSRAAVFEQSLYVKQLQILHNSGLYILFGAGRQFPERFTATIPMVRTLKSAQAEGPT